MSALARRLFGRNLRGSALTVRPSHSTSDIVYMAPQPPVDCSDKSRRQLRKEEKVEYYKKLNNMIHTDPDLNISEDKLAEFADGAFKNIMRLGKQNRFQDALRCYDATKHLQSPSRHYFTISFLIGACQTAELLPAAIRLFNEMSTNNFVPNEAAYVSLIRCFCDAGNEQAAIEIIGKMFSLGVEIKLRCCHPIVEVLCRDGDVANLRRAFEFIDYMTDKSVKIQTEQLIVLLDGIFKSEAKRHADIIDRMQQLLVMCSEYIFCLPDEEFLRLAASIRQIGIADITKEGVLTSDKYRDELNQFMGSVKLATEESAALSAGHNMHLNLLTAKELASRKPAAAAHVNIPHTAAVCPNCGGTLSKNFLPPDEQKRVRDALFGFAAAAGAGHMAHLKV